MTVNILGPYLEPLNIFSLILQQHCSLEPLSTKLLKETMDITLCAAASERTLFRELQYNNIFEKCACCWVQTFILGTKSK